MNTLLAILVAMVKAALDKWAALIYAKQAGAAEERERQAGEVAQAERRAGEVTQHTSNDAINNLERGEF